MVGIPIRCDIWQGVAVVGLMVGKAQQWDQLVRHRVTLNHQQQAAILYLWSQTFPESGNLSPDRGRFGRLAIDQLWQSDWGLRVEWCPASAMALRMYSEK